MDFYIALCYKCNHNCICCPLSTTDRLRAPLPSSLIKDKICAFLMNPDTSNGRKHVVISGGEPTIDEHFLEYVHMLVTGGANVSVLSNASACDDKGFVDALANALICDGEDRKAYFEYITAIHSDVAEEHDRMTNTPGSFSSTINGLTNLLDCGIGVAVKHIPSGITYKRTPDILKYLDTNFPPSVRFEICGMDYAGRAGKNSDVLFIPFETMQPYVEGGLDWIEKQSAERERFGGGGRRDVAIKELPLCALDPCYWPLFTPVHNKLPLYLAPNAETEDNTVTGTEASCSPVATICAKCDVHAWCQGIWMSTHRIGGDSILRPQKCEINNN